MNAEACTRCGAALNGYDGPKCPSCEEADAEVAAEISRDEEGIGFEPKTCPVCGSSDVVDDECQACAEIAREEDAAEAPFDEP